MNVFLQESAMELLERTDINDHTIDLEASKHPPYSPICCLGPVELEPLKTYTWNVDLSGLSSLPLELPSFLSKSLDGKLRLCVDYRGLNIVTIENQSPLPLISKSFDCLSRAKLFTQLDITNAYHQMRIWEGNEWKTAFQTRYNHFKYQLMPFKLSNSPTSFQGYVN